jgi:hypothetical protein
MSLKFTNSVVKPVQQQGVVVPMYFVNKPGIILPLYFVNKALIKQETEKVVLAPKPVRRHDPESIFGLY